MSNEIPESSKPIFDSELAPELEEKFSALFDEAYDLFNVNPDTESVQTAAVLLHQHITQEVTAHPILARTLNQELLKWSLVEVLLVKTYGACHETIQFLIETNPHVLLYARIRDVYKEGLIHLVAEDGWNCPLLPWIAERYPWVFQDKLCRKKPPHLDMVRHCVNERCDLETVRTFYELYPQGLREKGRCMDSRYPLKAILEGSEEPDADFFIWMAQQFPKAVYHKPIRGRTILHSVCYAMAAKANDYEYVPFKATPNMAKICRFLISEHPSLIRQKVRGGGPLPIHELANSCNRPLVQEMVILLLKAYPDCLQAKSYKWHPELPTVPFTEQVYPLIVDELEIDREIVMLSQLSQDMAKATVLSKNELTSVKEPTGPNVNLSLFDSVADVFCCWANLQVSDVLPARKRRIHERITDVRLLLEGDDVPDAIVDDEEEDEDGNADGAFEFNGGEGNNPDEIDEDDHWSEDSESELESEEEDDVPDESTSEKENDDSEEPEGEEGGKEDLSSEFSTGDRSFVVLHLGRTWW